VRCGPWRLRAAVLSALVAAPALAAAATLFGPYQHVPQGMTGATAPLIQTPAWAGPMAPVTLWAFAAGACGDERWGDFDTDRFARLNVAAFEQSGRDFIIATGGQADGFHCDSDRAMQRFVARYASPHLVGLDFDIERDQSPAQIEALVQRAQRVHQAQPRLRISFTVATHAASDGSGRSLNATGQAVVAALKASHFDAAIVNLMVMNYGPPDPRWCVPSADGLRCDMARSAEQAAHNVHRHHGLPYARLALTAMLGENDVAANVLTPDAAAQLARAARRLGLAGVHWWSLDRDQPCPPGEARVSPRCHALPGVPAGAFGHAFRRAFSDTLGAARRQPP
jgi:chitinase